MALYEPALLEPEYGEKAVSVGVWTAGMSTPNICKLTPWGSNEQPSTKGLIDVIATVGDHPRVLITYETTTIASGLTPQSTVAHLQVLDPTTCQLSARKELPTPSETGEGSRGRLTPVFRGAAEDVVALSVEQPIQGRVQLIGISVQNLEVAWTAAVESVSDWDTPRDACFFSASPPSTDPTKLGGEKRAFRVTDGKESGTGAGTIKAAFGCRTYLTYANDKSTLVTDDRQVTVDFTPAQATGSVEHVPAAMTTSAATGPVVIGSSGGNLVALSSTGTMTKLVDADKVEALHLKVHSASGGTVYVETTSEFLALALDGSVIGSPQVQTPTVGSDGERTLAGSTWTLWSSLKQAQVSPSTDAPPLPPGPTTAASTTR